MKLLIYIVALASIVAAIIALKSCSSHNTNHPTAERTEPTKPGSKHAPHHDRAPQPTQTTHKSANQGITNEKPFTPSSPEYLKHRAVRDFLLSPARDTQVARTMLKRLQDAGYGIEQLGPVYQAANHLTVMDPAFGTIKMGKLVNGDVVPGGTVVTEDTPETKRKRENMRGLYLRQNIFGQGWIKMDESLLGELIDMRPTVPYAQANADLYRDRKPDQYLNDQDLADYLAKTPANNQ